MDEETEFDWWTSERFDEAWVQGERARLYPGPGRPRGVIDLRQYDLTRLSVIGCWFRR